MDNLINEMLACKNWAVIGATPNRSKYGNTVFHKLENKGRNVYLVNPKYQEIEGRQVFSNIESINNKIDCISMVVNPIISIKVVKSAIKLGIKYIWFQPNTYNQEIIKLAEENGIKIIYGSCILWT